MRKLNVKNFFSVFIPLIPVFSIYASPIGGVDFATFCMILFTPFVMLSFLRHYKPVPILFSIFMIYLGLVTGISLFTATIYSSPDLIILRTGKFIFLVTIGFLGIRNGLFNYHVAVKALKVISIIASLILIMQYLLYRIIGTSFAFIISSLTVVDTNRSVSMYQNVGSMFRPSSIFLEPSYYFQYVVLTLTLLLFSRDQVKKRGHIFMAIIITVAVLLSTSGMGLVLVTFLWALKYLLYVIDSKSNKHIILTIVFLLLTIIVVPLLMKTEIVSQTAHRINTTDVGANALNARTVSYQLLSEFDLTNLVFGVGYGNILPEMFFSSLAYTIWTSGLIGAVLVFLILLSGIFRGDIFTKIFLLIYLVLISVSTVLDASSIVFYFTFLFAHKKIKKSIQTIDKRSTHIKSELEI